MLEISKLNLALNRQPILTDISLTVAPSSSTTVIGPSGAGKSSLLRCIAGLETYTGAIHLNGQALNHLPTAKRQLGYVEQDNTLLPHLTVAENIAYPLRVRKTPKPVTQTKTQIMMQRLHIAALARRYPHQISGGEQRRVMLARTLVYEPNILLFDEPFAGVDALLRVTLVRLLKDLLKQRHVPVLYVTHDLAEAQFLSDQTIVLQTGKIAAHATWLELTQQSNPWLQTFLQQRF